MSKLERTQDSSRVIEEINCGTWRQSNIIQCWKWGDKPGKDVEYNEDAESLSEQDNQVSAAEFLSPTIASWYRSFRNIAIVFW